ncbi:MAG: type II toxin-antitoxin system Phd/YefM family antitoxin [Anaerolineae bacterium]|nr:type II toxin-antitoxin system Phd/YefM family antitoxin [Anaerolineae bacterium]
MVERLKPKEISATEAANRFGSVVDEAARGTALFVVTRMGEPRAVVIGVETFREILENLETAEELADSEYLAGVMEAREDVRLGRTMTLEELEKKLELAPAEK